MPSQVEPAGCQPAGISPDGAAQLRELIERARRTYDRDDLAAAIQAVRAARKGLPPGHPEQPAALVHLAELLAIEAAVTDPSDGLTQALAAAVEAIPRAPRHVQPGAVGCVCWVLDRRMVVNCLAEGVEPAETVLSAARATADPDDPWLPVLLVFGLGAARNLRGRASADERLRRGAAEAFTDAARLLPAPESAD